MNEELKFTYVLPPVPHIEVVVTRGIEQLAEYLILPEKKIADVRVLTTEAIIYAFDKSAQHSNIRVEYKMSKEKFSITVTSYTFLPVSSDNAEKEIQSKKEWGLQILESLADEVSIEQSTRGIRIKATKFFYY